jgi:uncharacterized membrane protein YoaK (UPF0700 family)
VTSPVSVAEQVERRLTILMLLSTFGTGVVDAASYLGLHRVFTANMTGNVVFIGLGAVSHHAGIPVFRSVLALGSFLVGAALLGWYQRRDQTGGRIAARTLHGMFLLAGVLIAATALVALTSPRGVMLNVLTVLFGAIMGGQAAVARIVAVADVSTVVVTSTLASLVAEPWFGRERSPRTARRIVAGLAMGLGAGTGALLLRAELWLPMAVAACISAGVACHIRQIRQGEPQSASA